MLDTEYFVKLGVILILLALSYGSEFFIYALVMVGLYMIIGLDNWLRRFHVRKNNSVQLPPKNQAIPTVMEEPRQVPCNCPKCQERGMTK